MNALIVVVKNPIPGQVKTRLCSRYTADQAAAIYTAFVKDTLEMVREIDGVTRVIAYDPPDSEAKVRALFGNDFLYVPQVQADLGQRMYHALRQQLAFGAESAILIGTDIPSLPASMITRAFEVLADRDVVLGPSTDGGYYLVGMSRLCPDMFLDMLWSTSEVFSRTVQNLEKNSYSYGLVDPWSDVDSPEDLDALISQIAADGKASERPVLTHTLASLSALT
jgi:uncharacterized protein